MTRWHRVAAIDEMTDGDVRRVLAGSSEIALARHGGQYFALAGRCPHAGGPLAEGSIEGDSLVCPWHGREFELSTGVCSGFGGVRTFQVEVRADGVYVASPANQPEVSSP